MKPEFFLSIAIYDVITLLFVVVVGWTLDKVGVPNIDKIAGVIVAVLLVVGMASAVLGMLLSL